MRYRFHSPLGGLAADLTAEWSPLGAYRGFSLQVERQIHLAPPAGIHWRDATWLSFGLAAHAEDLMRRHPGGLVVRVTELTCPLAHFRPEVAALAIDSWIRGEFGVPDRGFRVSFDRDADDYRFAWGTCVPPTENGCSTFGT
ncbi:hypothetical protein [Streptomyces sp. NPDC048410]|uniref:hypothetical protein n=1 Tax=Streptomyces sp. NPDC048410 TaxID=3365545 RepID=UPI00371F2DCB